MKKVLLQSILGVVVFYGVFMVRGVMAQELKQPESVTSKHHQAEQVEQVAEKPTHDPHYHPEHAKPDHAKHQHHHDAVKAHHQEAKEHHHQAGHQHSGGVEHAAGSGHQQHGH